MRRVVLIAGLLLVIAFACTPAATAAKGPGKEFKVINQFALSGGGRWDYLTVDSQNRRLFMSRTDHVTVLNADTGKVIADIADTPGVHGIELVPKLGIGFISNGGENKVSVFDLKTLKTITKIATGGNPDSILYNPATNLLFVQNGKDDTSSVIDANTKKVVATIKYNGRPEFAVADGGTIFINIEDKNSIAVVDAAKKAVTATWPMEGCDGPTGLAMDHKTKTLFAACGANGKLAIVNGTTGKLSQLLPIGEDADAAVFDPATGQVFASAGDGKLSIFQKDASGKYAVLQDMPSPVGAKTMGLDPAKHLVYLPTAKFTSDPMKRPRPGVVDGSITILVIGQ